MILWQEVHYSMVNFAYYTELNFASTRINDAFVAEIVNKRLAKICMAIFALAERLPTSATLEVSNGMAGGGINQGLAATFKMPPVVCSLPW